MIDGGILIGVVVFVNVFIFWVKGFCNFIELCIVIVILIKFVMLYFNKNIIFFLKKRKIVIINFFKNVIF